MDQKIQNKKQHQQLVLQNNSLHKDQIKQEQILLLEHLNQKLDHTQKNRQKNILDIKRKMALQILKQEDALEH